MFYIKVDEEFVVVLKTLWCLPVPLVQKKFEFQLPIFKEWKSAEDDEFL